MTREDFIKELAVRTGIPIEKWEYAMYSVSFYAVTALNDDGELFLGCLYFAYPNYLREDKISLYKVDYKRGNIDPKVNIFHQHHLYHNLFDFLTEIC